MTARRTATADATPERKLPGALMRLVADGLKERGFDVHLPKCEDERRLSVRRWGGHCDLSVNDFGFVEWECLPWASKKPDPKLTADIVTLLLSGKTDNRPSQDNGRNLHGTSFKGIVGHELRARGFDVALDVCEDNELLEVWSDLLVKNPVVHANAIIRISDDGAISWECDYPYSWECDYPYEITEITDSSNYLAVLENHHELTDSIVTTVACALTLSSGTGGRS